MKRRLFFVAAIAAMAIAMPASATFAKKEHARYIPLVAEGLKMLAVQTVRAVDQKPAESAGVAPQMNLVPIGMAPMESVADLKKFDQIPTRGLVAKEKSIKGTWDDIRVAGIKRGIPTEGIGTGSGDIRASAKDVSGQTTAIGVFYTMKKIGIPKGDGAWADGPNVLAYSSSGAEAYSVEMNADPSWGQLSYRLKHASSIGPRYTGAS